MTKLRFISLLLLLTFTICGSSSCNDDRNNPKPIPNENQQDESFELSYWIDIDLRTNNQRGYWFNVSKLSPDILPSKEEIENASNQLSQVYHGEKLYVVYHRQFEIEDFKQVILSWKNAGNKFSMSIVPCIVLETYDTPSTMNFTDEEITNLAIWCVANINNDEFGVYDVYPRQGAGSLQDKQLKTIKEKIGNKIVHVGIQPGVELNSNIASAVQDTWTAECQGITNDLWENPKPFQGTTKYGKKLLQEWINERINGETRKIVWNMIPVAWDYDKPVDQYGYVCPGDNALTNDPPIDGRIALCDQYISACYTYGYKNAKFGGYSCDLHILEANSYGKPECPTFYEQLKKNETYTGYFSIAMIQISQLYSEIRTKLNAEQK